MGFKKWKKVTFLDAFGNVFRDDVCVKFESKLFLKEISTAASVEGQICN